MPTIGIGEFVGLPADFLQAHFIGVSSGLIQRAYLIVLF